MITSQRHEEGKQTNPETPINKEPVICIGQSRYGLKKQLGEQVGPVANDMYLHARQTYELTEQKKDKHVNKTEPSKLNKMIEIDKF